MTTPAAITIATAKTCMGTVDQYPPSGRKHPCGARAPELRRAAIEDMFGRMSDPVQTNPEKDPDAWTTGDEPMTGPQRSYLSTLAQEAGEEPPPDDMTKAGASKRIDELQERTGRSGR
jgi:hypothetical protein